MRKITLCCTAALGAALLLTGCVTTQSSEAKPPARAAYAEFTDATWAPEHNVRAPYHAKQLELTAAEAFESGIYGFTGPDQSSVKIVSGQDGSYTVEENAASGEKRVISWLTGSHILYRKGVPTEYPAIKKAEVMADGRLLLEASGKTAINVAVGVMAFDVSGLPVRQLLRNANNLPTELAYYVDRDATFPRGSTTYLLTYWLGDDEIVRPSASSITGANSYENLIQRFSRDIPFCLGYVNHTEAHPYGLVFEPVKLAKKTKKLADKKGSVKLVDVNRKSMFCQRDSSNNAVVGTWEMKEIRGTRVIELNVPKAKASDLGVQPINESAIGVGFAEIVEERIIPQKQGKGKFAKSVDKKVKQTQIIPVKIVRNNSPVVDFRLKYNEKAAGAVKAALDRAVAAKAADDAARKAAAQEKAQAARAAK